MKLAERNDDLPAPSAWRAPQSVLDWEWRHQSLPVCKIILLTNTKLALIVSVPTFIGLTIWLPEGLLTALVGTLLCLAIPLQAVVALWSRRRWGGEHCLDEKGVAEGSLLLRWENIIAYDFAPHPSVPNVRVLQLKVQQKQESERQFYFAPNEVSENQIRELLEEHI